MRTPTMKLLGIGFESSDRSVLSIGIISSGAEAGVSKVGDPKL